MPRHDVSPRGLLFQIYSLLPLHCQSQNEAKDHKGNLSKSRKKKKNVPVFNERSVIMSIHVLNLHFMNILGAKLIFIPFY